MDKLLDRKMPEMNSNKEEAETALADYFVVCGYDPAVGLTVDAGCDPSSPESASGSGAEVVPETMRPPMQRSYVAKILNHFPQKRRDAPFSEEILALCMPKGLRFYTEKDVPDRPKLHTFVNVKEDGSRVYGTALIFYEEVRDQYLCEEMIRLQMDHVKELTMRDRRSERSHVAPGTVSGGTHTLPRGNRADRMKRISYYDGGMHKQLYMTKTLCLITRLPMVNVTGSILQSFVEMISSSGQKDPAPLPLESYIYWILNEIPLPSPSTTLKVSLHHTPLILQRPGPLELPLFDYSLMSLFEIMTPEKYLRLLACFFLEHQILICSKELNRLMLVCESLCALAFPFRWSLAYAPILPYSQLKFIEAPVPYVMGLCYEDELPEYLFQCNVCVLDVDSGRAEFPEDMPHFPQQREICSDIRAVLKRFSASDESENVQTNAYANGEVANVPTPIMRNGSHLRKREDWSLKRMSRSFDGDALDAILNSAGMNGQTNSRPQLQPLPLDSVFKNNTTLTRVTEIARRAGVEVDVSQIESDLAGSESLNNSSVSKEYFKEVKFNNAVREVVLNRVAGMLYSYEHFVVGGVGCSDLEVWEAARDSVVSFDKASFLSDQPDSHLSFLAAFLETQMFTDFIDEKIKSQWLPPDENLRLFDARIKEMQQKLGLSMVRTPTYESTPPFAATEELISKREDSVDYVVPAPHLLSGAPPMRYVGVWPELNTAVLEGSSSMSPAPSPWKQRYNRRRPLESPTGGGGVGGGLNLRPTSIYGGVGVLGETPTQIAQQQLKFVEQLLKETKGKTKRMLVNKMGKEAVHLGHVDASVTGVEENTLVASFCDLLERIWSHGLIKKQGKSALWTFVLQHQDLEKSHHSTSSHKNLTTSMLTPASANPYPPLGLNGSKSSHYRSTSNLSSNGMSDAPLPPRPPRQPTRHAVPYPGTRRTPSVAPQVDRSEPQNTQTEASALTELVDSIQEFVKRDENPDAPAWQKNFFKAANSLFDKISEASRKPRDASKEREPGIFASVLTGAVSRSSSVTRQPQGPRRLKKCSSVSDFTTPGFGSSVRDGSASVEGSPRKRSVSRPRSPDGRVTLPSLPTHIAYDLKNVLRMAEIKTDIGYARAFVRLALERKLLHKHLATLLNQDKLTGDLYKSYAFVRCEDEREQFLYHILSLNAAQYRCFTNTFTKTKMDYQVVVVTGTWRGALPAIWMLINGSHTKTPMIKLPEGTPLFKFDHRNLGVLSTLQIGHSSGDERPAKWYLDYIIVRNEITGQMYRFPCGRWFGRGVDDGSLERLLVAEPIQDYNPDQSDVVPPGSPARGRRRTQSRSQTPQRDRSPSLVRESNSGGGSKKQRMQEIETNVGDAVNRIVKYFYSERQSRSELVHLLCGEKGLVPSIEAVFQFGRQDSIWSSRLFRQNYPWDYVEKFSAWFFECFRRGEAEKMSRAQRDLVTYALKLVQKIGEKPGLGKDGKFHVFVLITIRDHMLSGLLQMMAWCPVTSSIYDEVSFFRSPSLLIHMSKLLESLNEFPIAFEKSLTYGIG